jgi:hypothetical protein
VPGRASFGLFFDAWVQLYGGVRVEDGEEASVCRVKYGEQTGWRGEYALKGKILGGISMSGGKKYNSVIIKRECAFNVRSKRVAFLSELRTPVPFYPFAST